MSEVSAQCALHPGVLAVFACSRCGSFGCDACRSTSGSTFCRACKAPTPAILLGGLDFSSLLRGSLQQIRKNLHGLWLISLVWVSASHVANYVVFPALLSASVDMGQVVWLQKVLSLPAHILSLFFDASITFWMGESFLEHRRRSPNRALMAGPSNVSRLAPLLILMVATLLFPLTWFNQARFLLLPVAWTLALPGTVLGRSGAWAALRHTWGLTRGHRGSLLALFLSYFLLFRVLRLAIVQGILSLPLSSSAFRDAVKLFLPLVDVPFRILLVTAFTLFYLRRTQGAADASLAVETVPSADRR